MALGSINDMGWRRLLWSQLCRRNIRAEFQIVVKARARSDSSAANVGTGSASITLHGQDITRCPHLRRPAVIYCS